MNREYDWPKVVQFVATILMSMACIGIVCFKFGIDNERARALEAGAAKWTVDARTGEKKFQYTKE